MTHRLTSDDRLKSKVAALPPAQAAALPDQITGKAEGNFLYGVFLLNAAAEGQQALDALDILPSGLDGLYYSFLERIVRLGKEGLERSLQARARRVVGRPRADYPGAGAAYTGLPGDAWNVLLDLRQFVEVSPALSPTNGDEEPEDRYRLYHQSVVDFLRRRQIVTVIDGQKKRYDNVYRVMAEDWHKRIVATYRGDARSWEEIEWSRCDDYGLAHLPAHLSGAGSAAELHSILFVYRWLQAKLDRLGVNALLADFALGQPAADDATRRLGRALEQGAYVLAQDPAQLAAQLLGRLLDDEDRADAGPADPGAHAVPASVPAAPNGEPAPSKCAAAHLGRPHE